MGSSPFLGVSVSGTTVISIWPQASGPSGSGENTIAVFDDRGALRTPRLVDDPELSPLDLVVAPTGNIVVSSEWPFGARDAIVSVREYDPSTGRLARVLTPDPAVGFARPRGLRFGSNGRLYCVGQDHAIAFDFSTGTYLGVAVRLPRLNGQALVMWDGEICTELRWSPSSAARGDVQLRKDLAQTILNSPRADEEPGPDF